MLQAYLGKNKNETPQPHKVKKQTKQYNKMLKVHTFQIRAVSRDSSPAFIPSQDMWYSCPRTLGH